MNNFHFLQHTEAPSVINPKVHILDLKWILMHKEYQRPFVLTKGLKFYSYVIIPVLNCHHGCTNVRTCQWTLSKKVQALHLPSTWEVCVLVTMKQTIMGNPLLICPSPFFPKLETMIVNGMPRLERWHQEVAGQVAVVSFPQLKTLDIFVCPRLETVPEGLMQQLPALERLHIVDCPNLHWAFSRGGAYWNLVERIPDIYVMLI